MPAYCPDFIGAEYPEIQPATDKIVLQGQRVRFIHISLVSRKTIFRQIRIKVIMSSLIVDNFFNMTGVSDCEPSFHCMIIGKDQVEQSSNPRINSQVPLFLVKIVIGSKLKRHLKHLYLVLLFQTFCINV